MTPPRSPQPADAHGGDVHATVARLATTMSVMAGQLSELSERLAEQAHAFKAEEGMRDE